MELGEAREKQFNYPRKIQVFFTNPDKCRTYKGVTKLTTWNGWMLLEFASGQPVEEVLIPPGSVNSVELKREGI
jgi:hypothetical protein